MLNNTSVKDEAVLLNLSLDSTGTSFDAIISEELLSTETELKGLLFHLQETEDSLKAITPDCDKTDYSLAVASGALCGVIDVFLVGKPNESPIGEITDQWFEDRTKDFAKLCGWKETGEYPLHSAIRHLEKKFKVPYDQQFAIKTKEYIVSLSMTNHHFKSLGHNPTLLGLFFSILDQFTPESAHFLDEGEVKKASVLRGVFELRGNTIPSKIFFGFINWFGHLISDTSGSSTSVGRGMGIPSPFWAWTNDILVIRRGLGFKCSEFDKSLNELAVSIYKQGFDARFQSAQLIPVFINEVLVRFLFSARRFLKYIQTINNEPFSFSKAWKICEPFKNASVKRMLTVAHGAFCAIDVGDALFRGVISGGGTINVIEVFLRLNIAGIGRFAISLYGEANNTFKRSELENEIYLIQRDRKIIEYYINGLKELSEIYNDKDLLKFVDDFKSSGSYQQAFEKTVLLAEKRKVPEEKILRNISDIDSYFGRGN